MRIGLLVILLSVYSAVSAAPRTLVTDRQWQRLPAPADDARVTLSAAAEALEGTVIHLAGVEVSSAVLHELGNTPRREPLRRAVREGLGRPVDVRDFLYLLDDIAAAQTDAKPLSSIWLPSGRARGAGILLHPDDIFGDSPRRYGNQRLALNRPQRPADLQPAPDGAPLGPRWTARFANPHTEEAMLAALGKASASDFAARLRILLGEFRAQGAEAYVFSTVRSRARGYLIYGAFILSRARTAGEVKARAAKLRRLNRAWDLHVPIRWQHPDGWPATIEAAKAMANAYNVVYATQRGARFSSHYDGAAADFAVMDLPREITLQAANGEATRTFDLSGPREARDLNLTPALIDWVERHFGLEKLPGDYPHWTDARAEQP